jgi:hypothetical protein
MHHLWMNTDPAVLCCTCVGNLLSAGICCLVGGPVYERSQRSRLMRLLVLLQDLPPPQLLSAFPNSTAVVSSFCPLVGCKYLHLILSAACWVFQRTFMLGPFLWLLHSQRHSVRHWDLPLSWIPLLGLSLDLLFFRVLSIPVIISGRNSYWLEMWL